MTPCATLPPNLLLFILIASIIALWFSCYHHHLTLLRKLRSRSFAKIRQTCRSPSLKKNEEKNRCDETIAVLNKAEKRRNMIKSRLKFINRFIKSFPLTRLRVIMLCAFLSSSPPNLITKSPPFAPGSTNCRLSAAYLSNQAITKFTNPVVAPQIEVLTFNSPANFPGPSSLRDHFKISLRFFLDEFGLSIASVPVRKQTKEK